VQARNACGVRWNATEPCVEYTTRRRSPHRRAWLAGLTAGIEHHIDQPEQMPAIAFARTIGIDNFAGDRGHTKNPRFPVGGNAKFSNVTAVMVEVYVKYLFFVYPEDTV
jgi:hypothetical protein